MHVPEHADVISPARRFAPSLAWMLPLVALLALVVWDASARIARSLELSNTYGVAVRAPERDATSSTGFALERRSLLTPLLAPDTLHWVMQTQDMAHRGNARVRHVDYDNAPAGRAVHWAAPYRWWLLGLARLDRTWHGTPLPLAIERAALWAGPAMLVLALLVATPFIARRFGAIAGVVFAAGLVGCGPFAVQFVAGNADHHAPVAIGAMATVLMLVVGNGSDARFPRWHTASAAFGAAGLWLSAATMVPVLVGIGAGGAAARLWIGRTSPEVDRARSASAWRWWGAVGGGLTLLAWIIEYAPHDFSWRLEVIHPLYALAWYAGGELLARFSGLRPRQGQSSAIRTIAAWTLGGVALALPAVVILAAGSRVFLVSDPFLQSLHGDYIAEFQSLARFLSGRPIDLDLLGRFAPLVLLVAAFAYLAPRCSTPASKHELAVSTGAALAIAALAAMQIRWWGLAGGLSLIVAALASRRAAAGRERWIAAACALIVLAPGIVQAVRAAAIAREPTESDVRRLAERDVAHRLRLAAGGEPLVIAATPDETTTLVYFADARGIGTMYWENVDGLKSIAAFLGAKTPEAAHELVRRTGATHVVLFPWDSGDEPCIRLQRGLTPQAPIPADAFAVALRSGRAPSWLKPLPHRLPDHPLLRDQVVRIYEVTEVRPPERVAVDAAAFLMEMGRATEAASLEPVLASFPDDIAAQATLAGMQARRQDARAFTASLQRVLALSDRSAALPLADRLRVVMVLAIGGQESRAASELRQALAVSDERAVRRLSAGTLSDLLELAAALGVAWPDPRLRALAVELTPSAAR